MARTDRSRRPLAALGALGLAAAACGSGAGVASSGAESPAFVNDTLAVSPPSSSPDELPGDRVPGDRDPGDRDPGDSAAVDSAEVVAADRRLAGRLYGQLAVAGTDNLFFSPHSVAVALSMLEPGAAGATADQLRALLGVIGDRSSWHDARRVLGEQVATATPAPDGFEALRLGIANGFFGQRGYPVEPAYLDTLVGDYGADLAALDFRADAEGARQSINAWVAEHTEGHITDLLAEGSVHDLTRLVLANAVFFQGSWLTAFAEQRTVPAPFTTLDGAEVSAPTMHGNVRTSYATGDGWASARLPYAGGYSMLVVLPDEGRFAEVEGRAADVLAEVGATHNDHGVEIALPRFSFAASADLVPVLRALGLTDIFEPGLADLTGISTEGDLHVSGVAHQATVEVDEHGTTATAATGVVAGVTSMPAPASLVVDRPFIVAIEQDSTGELLFLGRVTDPTA